MLPPRECSQTIYIYIYPGSGIGRDGSSASQTALKSWKHMALRSKRDVHEAQFAPEGAVSIPTQ